MHILHNTYLCFCEMHPEDNTALKRESPVTKRQEHPPSSHNALPYFTFSSFGMKWYKPVKESHSIVLLLHLMTAENFFTLQYHISTFKSGLERSNSEEG